MAYDLAVLFAHVKSQLSSVPNLSLAELSRGAGVNRHTLHKAIFVGTGQSFRPFQQELTLKKAKQLLCSRSDMSIKEIGFSLGFKSERSFRRFVNRATSRPPVQLRRVLTRRR